MMVHVIRRMIVGIDPGASGGIAVLFCGFKVPTVRKALVYKMPPSPELLLALFTELAEEAKCSTSYHYAIEKVGGYVAGNPAPGSAMFNFGEGYGSLKMAALATTGSSPQEVRPQDWQKGLGIETRRAEGRGKKRKHVETKAQFKKRLRLLAAEMFPSVKVTASVADALLIAEFVRRSARS